MNYTTSRLTLCVERYGVNFAMHILWSDPRNLLYRYIVYHITTREIVFNSSTRGQRAVNHPWLYRFLQNPLVWEFFRCRMNFKPVVS